MMTQRSRRLLAPGDLLPAIALVEVRRGRTVSWCRSSDASVVVFPHPGECEPCRAYLAELAGVTAELAGWGARPVAVLPGGEAEAAGPAATLPYPVVADGDGEARRRCGVGEAGAAVIVADRWGAVVESFAGEGEEHPFPGPGALVRRATNLGIQCPECGVPDGGWATVSPVPLG